MPCNKHIIIDSKVSLTAYERLINASIWKQEKQTRHALEIARQAGALYDKFVAFVEDLRKVGANIETLDKTYQTDMQKLQNGTGNLIRRAEQIRALGIKTNKKLPAELLDTEDDGTA